MTELTLQISNPKDFEIPIPLLNRLGVFWAARPRKKRKLNPEKLAYLQRIIAAGGDATYFGDAAEWQRAERAERDLPFLQH